MQAAEDRLFTPYAHKRVPDEVAEALEALWTFQERGLTSLDDISRDTAAVLDAELLKHLCSEKLIAVEPSVIDNRVLGNRVENRVTAHLAR